jgi:anti-sigma B factor antagonist
MSGLSISVTAQVAGDGSCTVVTVAGEADVTTRELGEVLAAEAATEPRLLLIDMTELRFIDSAALNMIVRAYQRLHRDGGVMALVHPGGAVRRVLELTGIDQRITVYENADQAIEAFCQRNL